MNNNSLLLILLLAVIGTGPMMYCPGPASFPPPSHYVGWEPWNPITSEEIGQKLDELSTKIPEITYQKYPITYGQADVMFLLTPPVR
jgi:hypothetical protein